MTGPFSRGYLDGRYLAHLGGKMGLALTENGCVSSGFAISPDDFLGARHEFVG